MYYREEKKLMSGKTCSLDTFHNHSTCFLWLNVRTPELAETVQSRLVKPTQKYFCCHLPARVFLCNFTQFSHLVRATCWHFLSKCFFDMSIFRSSSVVSLLLCTVNLFHFLQTQLIINSAHRYTGSLSGTCICSTVK